MIGKKFKQIYLIFVQLFLSFLEDLKVEINRIVQIVPEHFKKSIFDRLRKSDLLKVPLSLLETQFVYAIISHEGFKAFRKISKSDLCLIFRI